MRRNHYSEYAIWSLKTYAINHGNLDELRHPTNALRHSFECCDRTFQALNESDREMMLMVYGGRDTIDDNVSNASRIYRVPQDRIWRLNDECIKRFAYLKLLI